MSASASGLGGSPDAARAALDAAAAAGSVTAVDPAGAAEPLAEPVEDAPTLGLGRRRSFTGDLAALAVRASLGEVAGAGAAPVGPEAEALARAARDGLDPGRAAEVLEQYGARGLQQVLDAFARSSGRPVATRSEAEVLARAESLGFDRSRTWSFTNGRDGIADLERFLDDHEAKATGGITWAVADAIGREAAIDALRRAMPPRSPAASAPTTPVPGSSAGAAAASSAATPLAPAAAIAPPAPHGTIALGGAEIPRLAPAPTPTSWLQRKGLALQHAALRSVPAILPGFTSWWTERLAEKVMETPTVRDATGRELSFGELAILRPGASNMSASAAFVFRVAQHAERTVVAYQNLEDPDSRRLVAVTEYDGVPVPPELVGKIFTVGSPDPCVIAPDQSSDQFLDALEIVRRDKDTAGLGVDPLTAKATVFGYSETTLDVPVTRQRLEEAGFPDAFGKVVAVASGAGAGAARESSFVIGAQGIFGEALDAVGALHPDWRRFQDALAPDSLRERFRDDLSQQIDLSIAGTIGDSAFLWGVYGGSNNIHPWIRHAQMVENWADFVRDLATNPSAVGLDDVIGIYGGGSRNSDGLVPLEHSQFGKKVKVASTPHDHLGMYADPAIVDEILHGLAEAAAAAAPAGPGPRP